MRDSDDLRHHRWSEWLNVEKPLQGGDMSSFPTQLQTSSAVLGESFNFLEHHGLQIKNEGIKPNIL